MPALNLLQRKHHIIFFVDGIEITDLSSVFPQDFPYLLVIFSEQSREERHGGKGGR